MGSDVLGFDTPQSMDQDWGCRLMLFLPEHQFNEKDAINTMLSKHLPPKVCGFSTHNSSHDDGTSGRAELNPGKEVKHLVTFHTIRGWAEGYLGYDSSIQRDDIPPRAWLAFPQQRLRTVSEGKIFHDDLGLVELQQTFKAYFPRKIWILMLAANWLRVSQEEPFVGRTGDVGDELGSQILAARQIHELMRLCFLMERQYWPYSKWFGTAFSKLKCSLHLNPIFRQALSAPSWKERESYLSQAYEFIAEMHQQLNLTENIQTKVSQFHSRPYLIIHAEDIVKKLEGLLKDEVDITEDMRKLGSIDQWAYCTDLHEKPLALKRATAVYDTPK